MSEEKGEQLKQIKTTEKGQGKKRQMEQGEQDQGSLM
jgi:hypothetical protein